MTLSPPDLPIALRIFLLMDINLSSFLRGAKLIFCIGYPSMVPDTFKNPQRLSKFFVLGSLK